MKRPLYLFLIFFGLLVFLPEYSDSAKIGYTEGDWVSFSPARFVTSIALDDYNVYFATRDAGVLRFDRFAEKWKDPLTISDDLPSNHINRIAFDLNDNELWIDARGGVGVYEPTFEDFIYGGDFPDELVLGNTPNFNPGSLFPEFGYNYMSGSLVDPYGRKYNLNKVYVDDRYKAWIGFAGLGPSMLNTRTSELKLLRFGPLTGDQRAVMIDGDYLFTGGYPESGRSGFALLDLYDMEWDYWEAPYDFKLHNVRINCVAFEDGIAWIGTTQGLVRFDVQRESFRVFRVFNGLLSNYISTIAIDGYQLWVGTDNGLNLLDLRGGPTDSLEGNTLPRNQTFRAKFIYDIALDENFIYVGYEDGIAYRARNADRWSFYTAADFSGTSDITSIVSTKQGLWLGHAGEIVHFDPQNEIRQGYTPAGLANSIVNDLIEYSEKDLIFAATDNGLVGINPATAEAELFDETDGLLFPQVFSIAVKDEYLWLATTRGLTRLYIPALRIY
ncbi:MAG: hypothetical protein GF315_13465 [candidate division Zixibacteria bacterium]|nr:hypothetical protein [candidate division Zixibacteria bacterium]